MPGQCPDSGAKVLLKASGDVVLNGQSMPAARLKAALSALTPKPTVICYSRDNPTGKPPATMSVVFDAIMALKLPIGMFTDATFTTPVKLE
jgi:hypothetical protein